MFLKKMQENNKYKHFIGISNERERDNSLKKCKF